MASDRDKLYAEYNDLKRTQEGISPKLSLWNDLEKRIIVLAARLEIEIKPNDRRR